MRKWIFGGEGYGVRAGQMEGVSCAALRQVADSANLADWAEEKPQKKAVEWKKKDKNVAVFGVVSEML